MDNLRLYEEVDSCLKTDRLWITSVNFNKGGIVIKKNTYVFLGINRPQTVNSDRYGVVITLNTVDVDNKFMVRTGFFIRILDMSDIFRYFRKSNINIKPADMTINYIETINKVVEKAKDKNKYQSNKDKIGNTETIILEESEALITDNEHKVIMLTYIITVMISIMMLVFAVKFYSLNMIVFSFISIIAVGITGCVFNFIAEHSELLKSKRIDNIIEMFKRNSIL